MIFCFVCGYLKHIYYFCLFVTIFHLKNNTKKKQKSYCIIYKRNITNTPKYMSPNFISSNNNDNKIFFLHIPIIMYQMRVDQSTTKAHVNVILDCCVSDATITHRYNIQYLTQVEEIVSK